MTPIKIGSADVPLENVSTKVLNVYRDGGSIIHLFCSYDELVRNLRDPNVQKRLEQAKINVDTTIECFEHDVLTSYVIPRLTMAMNPVILESLLLGTIARDAKELPKDAWPPCEGPGIYAVGISVNGRDGKFLCGHELLEVAVEIDAYADGWDSLQAQDPRTPQQRDKIKRAQSMENAILQKARTSLDLPLRFIHNAAEAARVRLLAERLRHRARASLDVDPAGNTAMVQSPLYIGCSTELKNCTGDYKLLNVNRINKLLGITVTAMCHCQYDPVLVVKPVLRIWDNNHLPIAERMISTIASSLVALDGFNATEIGGENSAVSDSTLSTMKENVFLHEGFHAANLEDAKGALNARHDYLGNIALLHAKQIDITARVVAMRDEFRGAIGPVRPVSECIAEMTELERRLDEVSEEIDFWNREIEHADRLLQAMMPLAEALAEMGLISATSSNATVVPGSSTDTDATSTVIPSTDAEAIPTEATDIPSTDATLDVIPCTPETSLDDID